MQRAVRCDSLCERCGHAFDAGTSYAGCCSPECAAAKSADIERRALARSRRWVAILAAALLMAAALWGITRVGSLVASARQAQHPIGEVLRSVKAAQRGPGFHQPVALQQYDPEMAVAAINTPDGTSEFSFPTVRTFCQALRLEGQAMQKHSRDEAAALADAIVTQFGARQVPDGDVVQVVRDGRTTCNGAMYRLPARITFVRDLRLRISGWVLANHLSAV